MIVRCSVIFKIYFSQKNRLTIIRSEIQKCAIHMRPYLIYDVDISVQSGEIAFEDASPIQRDNLKTTDAILSSFCCIEDDGGII